MTPQPTKIERRLRRSGVLVAIGLLAELISLLSARFRIRDLSVREPDIEDTIRRIYEERLLEP